MKTVNTTSPLNELSPAELDRLIRYHEARGRTLRSDAMKRNVRGFFASINKTFKAVAQVFSNAPSVASPRAGTA